MRRALSLLLLLTLLAGCRRTIGGPEPGAAASSVAVQQFLDAAKAGDLQAMSAVFGNDVSPLRDREGRAQVEQRMLIMACHLKHDQARVGPATPGPNGRVQHRVELTQGTKQASPSFVTVRNTRTGRWFVEEFEIAALYTFCASAGAPPARNPTSSAGGR